MAMVLDYYLSRNIFQQHFQKITLIFVRRLAEFVYKNLLLKCLLYCKFYNVNTYKLEAWYIFNPNSIQVGKKYFKFRKEKKTWKLEFITPLSRE